MMNNQHLFASALLNPELPCPADLQVWNGTDPTARFAIYRNNVIVSLIDALADSYPITQELVGGEFFREMARLFVVAYPPKDGVLAFYGEAFANFIDDFSPASSVPYLSDVARLEMSWIHAYHAADAITLSPEILQHALLDPNLSPALCFEFHPSFQLLSSRYAIVSLWAAHQDILDIATVNPYQAEAAVILRNGLQVNLIAINAEGAALMSSLMAGENLASAIDFVSSHYSTFDLTPALTVLTSGQAIITISHT